MTSPLSIRFDAALLERLRRRAGLQDSTPSGLAQRLVDEGLRSQEHPGIVFRGGPSGRRAALVAGPDVWEVIAAVRASGAKDEKRAIAVVAGQMTLPPAQVQLALEYYGSFPSEIDAQVAENERAASEALDAWRARQRLLA
ncbi:MAG TPA: hypothetical protein VFT67_15465 [Jatrophihabitantaceae bacterium]|jgi:hypothetical protein|nr:hypothetical protein [Jatrophihabitantaceae bacterium]